MESLKAGHLNRTHASVTTGNEIGDGETAMDVIETAKALPGASISRRPESITYRDGKPVFTDRIYPEATYDRLGTYEKDGALVDVFGRYEHGSLGGYLEIRRDPGSDRVLSATRIEPSRYETAPRVSLASVVAGRK